MFECRGGHCTEMLDYQCERSCKDITCDRSIIVLNGDNILLGNCQAVTHRDTGKIIWSNDNVKTLLANCLTIELDQSDPSNTSFIGIYCTTLIVRPKMFSEIRIIYIASYLTCFLI